MAITQELIENNLRISWQKTDAFVRECPDAESEVIFKTLLSSFIEATSLFLDAKTIGRILLESCRFVYYLPNFEKLSENELEDQFVKEAIRRLGEVIS